MMNLGAMLFSSWSKKLRLKDLSLFTGRTERKSDAWSVIRLRFLQASPLDIDPLGSLGPVLSQRVEDKIRYRRPLCSHYLQQPLAIAQLINDEIGFNVHCHC